MNTCTQTVSTETLLQLLAHPRRRTVLHHLIESGDEAVTLEELTETLATDDCIETTYHEFDDTRTRVELHHTHLPKLAAASIIEYDTDGRTVQYHSLGRVEKLLQFVSTQLQ